MMCVFITAVMMLVVCLLCLFRWVTTGNRSATTGGGATNLGPTWTMEPIRNRHGTAGAPGSRRDPPLPYSPSISDTRRILRYLRGKAACVALAVLIFAIIRLVCVCICVCVCVCVCARSLSLYAPEGDVHMCMCVCVRSLSLSRHAADTTPGRCVVLSSLINRH